MDRAESLKGIKDRFSQDWDELTVSEQISDAGDLTIYFLEMLAGAAASSGDNASAKNLIRATMHLEALVKLESGTCQKSQNLVGFHKIH